MPSSSTPACQKEGHPPMPRHSSHRTTFPRINLEGVRFAFDHLTEGNPYVIREIGRDAIRGCMLRVQHQTEELGTRRGRGARRSRGDAVRDGSASESSPAADAVLGEKRREEDRRFVCSGLARAKLVIYAHLSPPAPAACA